MNTNRIENANVYANVNADANVSAKNTAENSTGLGEIFTLVTSFAPILTSLGFIMGFTIGHIPFFEVISLILVGIGLVAALLCCPIRLLTFPLKCIVKGFKICRGFIPVYGVADLAAGIVGTSIGLTIGLVTVVTCPAIFTLKKYFLG